ncbi:hypothetical protein QQM39_03000 [Streptomyces sp. DT2A-34]|uniref:hypothetical protein n=1 Tax=Streptomyces sp. DT2A-34 TaxID=3051182 RepID=UPI00265C48FF|nr:hypothetical protein [Streptomyces sp. DT2A-34]MDO0909865.1 hypothetical protein [Streptomyces sp. DT2A-34]
MRRRRRKRASADRSYSLATAEIIHDRYWARELRNAAFSGVLLFTSLVLLDVSQLRLTPWRAVWWAVLGVLLLIVLTPARISVERRGLDARGLFTHHRVRTDHLVSVRISEGVSRRLVLRDAYGERVVLDPRVLAANPLIWHALDEGARRSRESGTLVCGSRVLEELGRRIDSAECRGILKATGLN